VDHPCLFFYASFILIAFGGGGCAAVAFTMVSLGLFALCHVQSPWVMLLFSQNFLTKLLDIPKNAGYIVNNFGAKYVDILSACGYGIGLHPITDLHKRS